MVQVLPQFDLGEILGGAVGAGVSQGLGERIAQFKEQQIAQQKANELIQAGFTPEQAQLFSVLPTGAQTALTEHIFEAQERGEGPLPFEGGFAPSEEEEGEVVTPEKRTLATIDKGLTKKEKVQRQNVRYDKNLPLFKEDAKKKEAAEIEGMKIQQLQNLNEANVLPSGVGRWNVKIQSGELRIPALASPEAQLFVKTINDFLIGAKETFGARVTNFEIKAFMKRLPTLANSEGGRRLIIRQMEIVNKLNQMNTGGILDVFEKAGGIRKIDYDQAKRFSEREMKPQIKELKKEFNNITAEMKNRVKGDKKPQNTILMRDPSGVLRRIDKKDVKSAQKEGYKLNQ